MKNSMIIKALSILVVTATCGLHAGTDQGQNKQWLTPNQYLAARCALVAGTGVWFFRHSMAKHRALNEYVQACKNNPRTPLATLFAAQGARQQGRFNTAFQLSVGSAIAAKIICE